MSLDAGLYLPEARTDLREAHLDYEDKAPGLGERFLSEAGNRVRAVRDNPHLYAVLEKDVRAAPVHHFPFVVYYRLDEEIIVILAVLHGHCDPSDGWIGYNGC